MPLAIIEACGSLFMATNERMAQNNMLHSSVSRVCICNYSRTHASTTLAGEILCKLRALAKFQALQGLIPMTATVSESFMLLGTIGV
ncbi:hypothetical protein J6590_011533 [Homalodisca vitripennis]|nr:hypothetical protein J6590_011533 [Homalodisca vitripennis]